MPRFLGRSTCSHRGGFNVDKVKLDASGGHCLLQAVCLELRFSWDFKAMVFITNVTKQQESGRVLPSIHRPKPSSLFFASDTMGTKVCWSMFSVCRIRPSDTIEFSPRRLFMSSEGGNTSSPLHVIRGWKYIGFCPAFQSGSELSFPAINDH